MTTQIEKIKAALSCGSGMTKEQIVAATGVRWSSINSIMYKLGKTEGFSVKHVRINKTGSPTCIYYFNEEVRVKFEQSEFMKGLKRYTDPIAWGMANCLQYQ